MSIKKIDNILIRPSLSGQDVTRGSFLPFLQPFNRRAMDIPPKTRPNKKGKKPGPGLSRVPKEYFLASTMMKMARTINKTLLIFSIIPEDVSYP